MYIDREIFNYKEYASNIVNVCALLSKRIVGRIEVTITQYISTTIIVKIKTEYLPEWKFSMPITSFSRTDRDIMLALLFEYNKWINSFFIKDE